MLDIYIDADACPVREEVYKVAARYQLRVLLVANSWMNHPSNSNIEMKVVSGGFDAADDWIVEQVSQGDIVISSDVLLADRCIKKQARVLGPKGEEFTEDNIGSAVASLELNKNLRYMGEFRGGPSPLQKNDRSKFLSQLDQVIHKIKNSQPKK